jgi:hypothetical protein
MDHRLFDGGCARPQSMQANDSVQRVRSNILIIRVGKPRFPDVFPPENRLPQAVHALRLPALAEWGEGGGTLHRGVCPHAAARHHHNQPVLAAELARPDRDRLSAPGLLAALAKPGLPT